MVQTQISSKRRSPPGQHLQNSSPQPQQTYLAKTFGVELEFILAFHQSELERVLEKYSIEADIVKHIPHELHKILLDEDYPEYRRTRWPEWILQIPRTDASTHWPDEHEDIVWGANADRYDNRWYRPYFLEPLLIAKDALTAAGHRVNVNGCTGEPGQETKPLPGQDPSRICVVLASDKYDYTKWNLTNDWSLLGATKGELQRKLGGLIGEEDTNDWDSHGIELISPVFQYSDGASDAAFLEIHRYLAAVRHERSTPPSSASNSPSQTRLLPNAAYRAFDSVFAGCHVHIGFDVKKPTDISLLFLKHLMFIVMSAERLISDLHPRHRSGTATLLPPASRPRSPPEETPEATYIRLLQEEEDIVRNLTNNWSSMQSVRSNRALFLDERRLLPNSELNEIANEIFSPHMTFDTLKGMRFPGRCRELICNMKHLMAFCDGSSNGKVTVEFRQHGCVLNAAELKHWVKFLFALVHMAERMAAMDPVGESTTTELEYLRELRKYDLQPRAKVLCKNIEELCGEKYFRLEESEIRYWRKRYDQYAVDRAGSQLSNATISRVSKRRVHRSRVRKMRKLVDDSEMRSWKELEMLIDGIEEKRT